MDLHRFDNCRPESASEFIYIIIACIFFCHLICETPVCLLAERQNCIGSGPAGRLLPLFRARAMWGRGARPVIQTKREGVGDRV